MTTAEELGMQAANAALNTGIGILTAKFNDRRQIAQQRKLNALQEASQMKMWEQTNYAAQREQMQKAGLNVGLMYGMGGGAGTTTGSFNSGQAPSGGGELGMGLMTKAQMDLIKAQTANVNADTKAKEAGIPKTGAETKNITADTAIKELQASLLQIQTSVQGETIDEQIRQITAAAEQKEAEVTAAGINNQNLQKQIDQNLAESASRIAANRSGIQLNDKQIENLNDTIWNRNADTMQKWQSLDIEKKNTFIKEKLAESQINLQQMGINDAAKVQQVVNVWRTVLDGIVNGIKALKP